MANILENNTMKKKGDINLDLVTHYYTPNYINEDTDGQMYFCSYKPAYYPVIGNAIGLCSGESSWKDQYYLNFIIVVLPNNIIRINEKCELIRQERKEYYYTVMCTDLTNGILTFENLGNVNLIKVLEKANLCDNYLPSIQISPFIIHGQNKWCELSLRQAQISFIKEIVIPTSSCIIEGVYIVNGRGDTIAHIPGQELLVNDSDNFREYKEKESKSYTIIHRYKRSSELLQEPNYYITLNKVAGLVDALISVQDSATVMISFKEITKPQIEGCIHYQDGDTEYNRNPETRELVEPYPRSVELTCSNYKWTVEKKVYCDESLIDLFW